MTILLPLLLATVAPQADGETCAATRFTLGKPVTPAARPSEPEKTRSPQLARPSGSAKPKPAPKPGDCSSDKKGIKG